MKNEVLQIKMETFEGICKGINHLKILQTFPDFPDNVK